MTELRWGNLEDMLVTQHMLQRETFHNDPTMMTTEEAIVFIHWNVTALTDELHEMLAEIGWKPWASSKHINGAPAAKEMIDAWHFFMNIMLALGPFISQGQESGHRFPCNVQELAQWWENAYYAKKAVNEQRQAEGYDGVSTKCGVCKRELSEVNPSNPTCGTPAGCPFMEEKTNG